jgi:hypothetical protein
MCQFNCDDEDRHSKFDVVIRFTIKSSSADDAQDEIKEFLSQSIDNSILDYVEDIEYELISSEVSEL